jgi:hypothetical protein
MPTTESVPQEVNPPFRTMGMCWVIYGVIRLAAAFVLFYFSGTATVMFGALLNRAPNPFALMSGFHAVYTALIVLSVVVGILGIIAGLALMGEQQSARGISILAAFLSLCDIPLGITLGTYTLIVMLPRKRATAQGTYARAA